MAAQPKESFKCELCRCVVLPQVYVPYRGRCIDCRVVSGELIGLARQIALDEHCAWIDQFGSLRKAIEGSERVTDDSPIGRWFKAHSAKLAERRMIRNSKISTSVKRAKAAAKRERLRVVTYA